MKKVIAIVAVIASITAILCIGANAINGITLNDGDIITFKNNVETLENKISIRFTLTDGSKDFYGLGNNNNNFVYYMSSALSEGNYSWAYDYRNNSWNDGLYHGNKIKIKGAQVITDGIAIEWLYDNTNSGLPERPLQKTIDNTKATFATTLTLATAIIAWLMANQIALVGLYLYILIALVATGKRFIKGV